MGERRARRPPPPRGPGRERGTVAVTQRGSFSGGALPYDGRHPGVPRAGAAADVHAWEGRGSGLPPLSAFIVGVEVPSRLVVPEFCLEILLEVAVVLMLIVILFR